MLTEFEAHVIFIRNFGILIIVRKLNIKNVCRGLVFHTIKHRQFIHAFGQLNLQTNLAMMKSIRKIKQKDR